ncbi:unnamed protein product, partial [Dovyalis caffra]
TRSWDVPLTRKLEKESSFDCQTGGTREILSMRSTQETLLRLHVRKGIQARQQVSSCQALDRSALARRQTCNVIYSKSITSHLFHN